MNRQTKPETSIKKASLQALLIETSYQTRVMGQSLHNLKIILASDDHLFASKRYRNYLSNTQGLRLCVEGQGLNPCILNREHTFFVDYISKDTHHNFY